ncbi:hypothetical protein BGZ70_005814 [Mortierella alpina]|uniref:Uncharacterized protein n=1 Tax=Mortierella alpina TaxID=64518 RepID=A0A9P6M415_MORAP|nr:hypothetical protein BGZ70_005814 [Mortierella alpina]
MYLDQTESAFVFTVLRLCLQTASVYLLTAIAARALNLTCLEHINTGVLSQLAYILRPRLPSPTKHHTERLLVLLILIISIALTWFPTLLSRLCPVQPTYIPKNAEVVPMPYRINNVAQLVPGHTNTIDMLSAMEFNVKNTIFHQYNAEPLAPVSCSVASPVLSYGVNIPCPSANMSLIIGNYNLTLGGGWPLLNTSHNAEMSRPYANGASNDIPFTVAILPSYTAMTVYNTIAAVFFDNVEVVTVTLQGLRSVEGCLAQVGLDRVCARHGIGYLSVENKGLVVIERRLRFQSMASQLTHCDAVTMPWQQQQCRRITDKNGHFTDAGDLFFHLRESRGVQRSRPIDQGIRWDFFWVRSTEPFVDDMTVFMESMSVDITVTVFAQPPLNPMVPASAELFETTAVGTTEAHMNGTFFDSSKEFTAEDRQNLINFVIQALPLYAGGVVVLRAQLLAALPDWVVVLVAILIVAGLAAGYWIGRKTDPLVSRPLSEIVAEAVSISDKKKKSKLLKRKVAQLDVRWPDPEVDFDEMGSPRVFANNQMLVLRRQETHFCAQSIELDEDGFKHVALN